MSAAQLIEVENKAQFKLLNTPLASGNVDKTFADQASLRSGAPLSEVPLIRYHIILEPHICLLPNHHRTSVGLQSKIQFL